MAINKLTVNGSKLSTHLNSVDGSNCIDINSTITGDKLDLNRDSIIKFLKPNNTKASLKEILQKGYLIDSPFDEISEVFVNGLLLEKNLDYIINKKYVVFQRLFTSGDRIVIKGSTKFIVEEKK
jgi:hypothetical protein